MLTSQRKAELLDFCSAHNLKVDLDKLDVALTHKSYSHEQGVDEHNERLEFLGDAVLGLVIGEYLFELLPDAPEGDLALLRASTVNAAALAKAARQLYLGQLLKLGKGEEMSGGRDRESLLANAFEAVIGAIYLSAGLEEARRFILKQLAPEIDRIIKGEIILDPKSTLQEILQKHAPEVPQYHVIRETGPDHAREFYVEVRWQDQVLGYGQGRSKKAAEQEAARQALDRIEEVLDSRNPPD